MDQRLALRLGIVLAEHDHDRIADEGEHREGDEPDDQQDRDRLQDAGEDESEHAVVTAYAHPPASAPSATPDGCPPELARAGPFVYEREADPEQHRAEEDAQQPEGQRAAEHAKHGEQERKLGPARQSARAGSRCRCR